MIRRLFPLAVLLLVVAAPPTWAATQAEVQRAQQALNTLGYDAGTADGLMGSRTRNAIRMFQADKGLALTGEVDATLLSTLDAEMASRGLSAPSAAASPPPGGDPEAQALVDELRRLIEEGERSRAADAWFLDRLRALVGEHDWPWRREALTADFRNPASQGLVLVDAGRFTLDRDAGLLGEPARQGSSGASGEELAAAILGAFLQGGSGSGSSGSQAAVLAQAHLSAPIANAFALSATISARRATGPFSIGLYRDALTSPGYRLAVQAGAGAELAIVRVERDGSLAMVGSATWSGNLADGRMHELQWTRDRRGRMTVSVDGTPVLDVTDTRMADPFQGVLLRNQGGDWALRDIAIDDAG